MSTSSAVTYDTGAIGLSGLCLFHCLALPLLAAAFPILGAAAEAEWLHRFFVIAAVPISLLAMFRGGGVVFIGLAILGLALLILGAFVEQFHDYEVTLTVMGALVLSAAHIWRWRRHRVLA